MVPVDLEVQNVEQPATPSHAVAPAATPPSGTLRARAVNVLLVDDQPANLVALEAILEGLGQNLLKAQSGREALRILLAQPCALAILDVRMPDLDGFETARLIRERPCSSQTPIIFLTAGESTEAHVFTGYAVGAVDYMQKPFVPEVLRSKVSVFVELARKTELVKQQAEHLAQKNAELERARARAEHERARAERESRFKSRFLARMSHELRTPLNAILGFSELLQQELHGPLAPKQRDYLALVVDSGRHLLALVNDVLDLSKVEAGRLELAREWTPIAPLVAAVEGLLAPLAAKQGVSLTTQVAADLPPLFLDPLRIKEVLLNLVSNAIKFTAGGGRISLAAGREDGFARIRVSDDGIGIGAEDMPRLFREFEQIAPAPGALATPPKGAGLGLVISQRLVALHGGTITVASEAGKGTLVTVSLPLGPAARDEREAAS